MTNTLDYSVDAGYIQLPVNTNPTTLAQNAMTAIGNNLPGWIPRESHIEVLLLEQFAAMCAESATVSAQVPQAIFSYFGSLIGITPEQGFLASAQTTWTMVDNHGYTVPAGAVVGYQVLGNQLYLFQTVSPFTVPAGSLQTAPGAVLIQAQSVGALYNGLAASAYPNLVLVSPAYSFVASISPTTTTSGGADAETTAAYLNRLSDQLQLLAPRPILADDFAAMAQSVDGVYRATAFSGVNPYGNILSVPDGNFTPNIGTWTVASGTTTLSDSTGTLSGLNSLHASVTSTSILETNAYAVAGNTMYLAMVQMDEAAAGSEVILYVNCYDVNNTLIGSGFSSPVAAGAVDNTTTMSTFWVQFTTPSNAFTVRLEPQITGTGSAVVHSIVGANVSQIPLGITNLVPDSSMQQVSKTLGSGVFSWAINSPLFWTPYATGIWGAQWISSGTTVAATAQSAAFFLAGAHTYTITAYVDASNCTTSTVPQVTLVAPGGSAPTITWNTPVTEGVAGTVVGTFTVAGTGGGQMLQIKFNTNNCVVASGNSVTFAQPQITLGDTHTNPAAYTAGPTFAQPGQLTNQERTVTVAAVDVDGDALAPDIEANLSNYLEAQREVNFIVDVVGPSYTSIDVHWAGVCVDSADPDTVLAAANAALNAYLSPANWAGGNAVPPYWDPSQTVVRYLSVATLLNDVAGMNYLTALTIGYSGGTLAAADVDLRGVAPLPTAGSIIGTVVSA